MTATKPDEFHIIPSGDTRADFRHRARYEAFKLAYRGHVLDVGCGSGYGLEIIRDCPEVKSITGVDVQDVVDPSYITPITDVWAMDFLDFKPPHARLTYQTIVMIEVIEHLEKGKQLEFINHTRDLANRNSVLCITTPRAGVSGPSETNPHHKRELSLLDFAVLCGFFGDPTIWTFPPQVFTDGKSTSIMCAMVRAG